MAIPNCWVVFMCQRSYVILAFVLWNELSLGAIFGSLNCWFAVCRHDGGLSRMVTVTGSPRGSVRGCCGWDSSYGDGNSYELLISMPCTKRCSMRYTAIPTCKPARTSDTRWPIAGCRQGSPGGILENWTDVFLLSTTKRSVWACHYLITGLLMKSRNCGNDIMSNDVQ